MPSWLFSYVSLLLFIVAAVVVFGKLRLGWRGVSWPFPLVCCFLGAVLLLVAGPLVTNISQTNSEALTAFENGQYSVVEGIVTDFHPMPYEGHDEECFSVATKRFCYSDYEVTPGFHNSASHGGPIRLGLRVRVAFTFNTILRLEIAKDQLVSPGELSEEAKSAEADWRQRMERDPFQQRMMAAFSFTTMCWTLWWNLQWRRAMRFWVRPPNRPITQLAFRVFFALSFVGSVDELVRQLHVHPLTSRNALPTLATAAIMLCVVGSMTALAVWWAGRTDRGAT